MRWEEYEAEQEYANEQACAAAAGEHGVEEDERLSCEGGDAGCPNCPFADNSGESDG